MRGAEKAERETYRAYDERDAEAPQRSSCRILFTAGKDTALTNIIHEFLYRCRRRYRKKHT